MAIPIRRDSALPATAGKKASAALSECVLPVRPLDRPDHQRISAMTTVVEATPAHERELVLCRIIDAPREKVYRCWTDGKLMPQWFAPKPWETPKVEVDVRAGGSNLIVMRGPDGQEFPNRGVYLEVTPNEKLVFTDSFTSAWEPSEKPFMTATLTFEDAGGGKTRYTARVSHPTVADRERHEEMGFHAGWGICTDQLEALAKSL
jgi:uncharacterized protein YndB with AHSA1/START domain